MKYASIKKLKERLLCKEKHEVPSLTAQEIHNLELTLKEIRKKIKEEGVKKEQKTNYLHDLIIKNTHEITTLKNLIKNQEIENSNLLKEFHLLEHTLVLLEEEVRQLADERRNALNSRGRSRAPVQDSGGGGGEGGDPPNKIRDYLKELEDTLNRPFPSKRCDSEQGGEVVHSQAKRLVPASCPSKATSPSLTTRRPKPLPSPPTNCRTLPPSVMHPIETTPVHVLPLAPRSLNSVSQGNHRNKMVFSSISQPAKNPVTPSRNPIASSNPRLLRGVTVHSSSSSSPSPSLSPSPSASPSPPPSTSPSPSASASPSSSTSSSPSPSSNHPSPSPSPTPRHLSRVSSIAPPKSLNPHIPRTSSTYSPIRQLSSRTASPPSSTMVKHSAFTTSRPQAPTPHSPSTPLRAPSFHPPPLYSPIIPKARTNHSLSVRPPIVVQQY